MADHRTARYADRAGPFDSNRSETQYYGPDGNAADESVATTFTESCYDGAGAWVGGADGIILRPA